MISVAVFAVGVVVSGLVAWALVQIGRIESQLVTQARAEKAAAEARDGEDRTPIRMVA